MDTFKTFRLIPTATAETVVNTSAKPSLMSIPLECRLKIYAPLIAENPLFFYYNGFERHLHNYEDNEHAMLSVSRTTHTEYKGEALRTGEIVIVLDADDLCICRDRTISSFPPPAAFIPHNVLQYGRSITISFGYCCCSRKVSFAALIINELRSLENPSIEAETENLSAALRGKSAIRFTETMRRSQTLKKFTLSWWDRSYYDEFHMYLIKGPKSRTWTGTGRYALEYELPRPRRDMQWWDPAIQGLVKMLNGPVGEPVKTKPVEKEITEGAEAMTLGDADAE